MKLKLLSSIASRRSSQALQTILLALNDPDPRVRGRAAQLLSKYRRKRVVSELLRHLDDEDLLVRRRVAITLGSMGNTSTELLLRVLKNPETHRNMLAYAAMALGYTMSKRAVDELILLLESPLSDVRAGAAEGLAVLASERAVVPLIRILKDESPEVRKRVVHALGRIGDPTAIPALLEALKDADAGVRWRVVYTLGEMRRLHDQDVFEGFIQALGDPDWNVRRIAVIELRHEEDRAVDPLIRALKDANSSVRRYAAFGLGRSGDTRAVDPLVNAARDESEVVAQHARWALEKIAEKHRFSSVSQMLSKLGLNTDNHNKGRSR